MPTGRIAIHQIDSQALRGNRLADPHLRALHIYLPPGYDDAPARDYPLVLMLASHGNSGPSLLNWRGWEESVNQQADRLINTGVCPPFIMALPDTWTCLGGTLHLNCPAFGHTADHLFDEVIPFVEANYRARPGGAHRAIIGRSSGGYGALYHAMTRPGMFAAAACHSGDAYFLYSTLPEIAKLSRHLESFGGLAGLLAEAKMPRAKSSSFFEAAVLLAQCANCAPNIDEPHGFDLPIDLPTGALREDVWARLLAYDPIHLVRQPAHAAALAGLKELFIDCGRQDEYNLHVGARLLSASLRAAGVPHTAEEYAGGHRGTQHRYDVSLPRLVGALVG
jgi:enterochelin esterase family protein